MATKQLTPNLAMFKQHKDRITDLYQNCGDLIRRKTAVLSASNIFTDMRDLLAELKRLGDGYDFGKDLARLKKVRRFVNRVCDEQAAAIKTGAFIRIGAEIFGAYRFLVRTLETLLSHLLDDEELAALGQHKLAEEHVDRITLDLTEEGITDPDDDDDDGTDLEKKPRTRVQPREPVSAQAVSGLGVGKVKDDDLPGDAE